MNTIEIVAIVAVAVLALTWCYYHMRLAKARKEGQHLKAQLKDKEEQDAKDHN